MYVYVYTYIVYVGVYVCMYVYGCVFSRMNPKVMMMNTKVYTYTNSYP